MSYVELDSGRFYQHVIYVHLHGRSYLLLEHPVHQPLIGSSCIFEPKRHHTITIGSLPCDEQGFFLVNWVHADLVVAGEGIHKTKEFMQSRHGKGKLSFGHALLTSVKSMQSRHLSFTFFTNTTLASHSGYSTSLIAPVWRSFPTSSLIAFFLSGAKLLLFCLTGLKDGLTFSLCVIIVGSIPTMSTCFHAKTSLFCLKKLVREFLRPFASLEPMYARCSRSSASNTDSSSSDGSSRYMLSIVFCFMDAE